MLPPSGDLGLPPQSRATRYRGLCLSSSLLALGKFNREPKTKPKELKPKSKEPEPKNSVPYSVPNIEEPK
jgi:hypothetical protein